MNIYDKLAIKGKQFMQVKIAKSQYTLSFLEILSEISDMILDEAMSGQEYIPNKID